MSPLSDESVDKFLGGQVDSRKQELSSLGGSKVVSGLDKTAFDHQLNNPISTKQRPRKGIVDRQQSVVDIAKKADPLMRVLDQKGNLRSTHEKDPLDNRGRTFNGLRFNGSNELVRNNGSKVYTYGMDEFGNREGVLPNLTNSSGPQGDGRDARPGRWSESDVNPVKRSGFYHHNGRNYLESRGTEHLLFTGKGSKMEAPNGTGGTSEVPVDYTSYVTEDHYKSVVPVTPVEKGYKSKNPYTSPYMDPQGKKSSLELHDEKMKPPEPTPPPTTTAPKPKNDPPKPKNNPPPKNGNQSFKTAKKRRNRKKK